MYLEAITDAGGKRGADLAAEWREKSGAAG
jgi:hypothetical protein